MRTTARAMTVLALLAVAGCGTQDPGQKDKPGDTASSPAPAAGAATAWDFEHVDAGQGEITDLAALAKDDIWAVGHHRTNGTTDADQQFLLHYDGTGWQRQDMPDVLGDAVFEGRLDALGEGRLWLSAASEDDPYAPRLVEWDGSRWSTVPEPPAAPEGPTTPAPTLSDIVAFGPDDVSMLVGGKRLAHWDGARWTTTELPAEAKALDGTASDDLWAVGFRDSGPGVGGDSKEYTQPAAMHWDGDAWKSVDTPQYRFPDPIPPEPGASLDHVLAASKDDVVAYGSHSFNHGEVEDEPDAEFIRLRWDGTRWSKQTEEYAGDGECGRRVPLLRDGGAGTLFDGNWYRSSDGTCAKLKRPELPSTGGITDRARQGLGLAEVATVPGTDDILGVGHVAVMQSGNPMSKPVVVRVQRQGE